MQCGCSKLQQVAVCCSEENGIQFALFQLPYNIACVHVWMQCACSVVCMQCCSALQCVTARKMGFKSLIFNSPTMEPVHMRVCSAHAMCMQSFAARCSVLQARKIGYTSLFLNSYPMDPVLCTCVYAVFM